MMKDRLTIGGSSNVRFRPVADIHVIDEDALVGPEVENLAEALARCRCFLVEHDERYISARLEASERGLTREDLTAIVSAVSEATGGMGSLNDYVVGSPHLDARLRGLVLEVERRARAAAAAERIDLLR